MNKPFKTYNGGKESDGTYQKIINRIPYHDIYIEPFLGNGAILRNKKLAEYSIGIDKDTAVIKAWQQNNIPGCNFINTDGIQWLENFKVSADIFNKLGLKIFIYIDPPYPKSSRKNKQDLYLHEMIDRDHTKLLSVAGSIPSPIAISSYPNEIYNKELSDWNNIEFQSTTRHGVATEKLWFNYPPPTELHDYRYLGEDYRERERIKGIIHRNVSKFKRMPAAERNALINSLKENEII